MENLPGNDNEVSLVHGDFRLDNLIFHPTEVQCLWRHTLSHLSATASQAALMSLGARDSRAGLGAVYHRAALGRPGLLLHASLLAQKPQHHQLNGQLERHRRLCQQMITSLKMAMNRCIDILWLWIFVPLTLFLIEQESQLWVIWCPSTAGAGGSQMNCQSWISTWPWLSSKWQELPRSATVLVAGVPRPANSHWYCPMTKDPVVHQGIYARHLLGNASAPQAAQFSQCVEPLAKVALQLVQRSVAV